MIEAEKPSQGRRRFLKVVAVGASAMAAPQPAAALARIGNAEGEEKSQYRETEHVKTFYRVARYPMR